MKLLLDIGNTRLKWLCSCNGNFSDAGALLNSQLSFAALVEAWSVLPTPFVVAISCVNSPEMITLSVSVASHLWPGVVIFTAKSAAYHCGVRNAYAVPEKLGVDRWLALVAVHNFYRQAACVVDCGTAITVDLLDIGGRHLGGVICPGLTLMQKALVQGTHQLAASEGALAVGLADNTVAAIYSGALWAACGLIEKIAARHKAMQVILTGGDAECVAAQLACPAMVDDKLVLRGLCYAAGAS